MGGLEQLMKGMGVGATRAVDGGYAFNLFDRWTGIGDADRERAIPTLSAKVTQHLYDDYKQDLPFETYAARFAGQTIGGLGATAALLGIGYLAAPVIAPLVPTPTIAAGAAAGTAVATAFGYAAATGAAFGAAAVPILIGASLIPAVTGIYGLAATAYTYVRDFVRGEKREGHIEKGSFLDGIRAGYHAATHWGPMYTVHNWESSLTGRGAFDSHLESTIMSSSGGVRRNFRSLAGYAAGAFGTSAGIATAVIGGAMVAGPIGAVAAATTIGIGVAYKSIRDFYRTAVGQHRRQKQPRYRRFFGRSNRLAPSAA